MWGSEDHLEMLALSYHANPGNRVQGIRLSVKYPHQRLLTDSSSALEMCFVWPGNGYVTQGGRQLFILLPLPAF